MNPELRKEVGDVAALTGRVIRLRDGRVVADQPAAAVA